MQVQKISETIQKFDGLSYYRCGQYFRRKGKLLHRAVWEAHNGPIPEGYEVHHKDKDRSDNDIENLQLLPESEHRRIHMMAPERKEQSRKNIKMAVEAARDWHSTPEGFDFHSKHAKETWAKAEPRTYICTYCGKEYQSMNFGTGGNTFCCNNHKAAWRRQQGLDNEERTCPVCGKTFMVSKYAKNVCCGYECARKRRWGK